MKLIIQIPCFDEAETLPVALDALPKAVEGADRLEVLVIDDGSADATSDVARGRGADHVLALPSHLGLAAAFSAGIKECLRLGADIIVNTDADNQYRASDIPALVRPILEGKADVVVGDRQNERNRDLSFTKRALQKYGSRIVSALSGSRVPDAASGFRAFSRDAASRLGVLTGYSHTLESLIQMGALKLRILSVPVGINPPLRKSRLIKSDWSYLWNQGRTLFRAYAIYRPLRTSVGLGVFLAVPGAMVLAGHFLRTGPGGGAESAGDLILAAALLATSILACLIGLIAEKARAGRGNAGVWQPPSENPANEDAIPEDTRP